MGADIAGACGQLVVEQEMKKAPVLGDIEDGPCNRHVIPFSEKAGISHVKSSKRDGKRIRDVITETSDNDRSLRILMIATGIAASCFFISTALLLMKRGKK
jgi:hypothetical protein